MADLASELKAFAWTIRIAAVLECKMGKASPDLRTLLQQAAFAVKTIVPDSEIAKFFLDDSFEKDIDAKMKGSIESHLKLVWSSDDDGGEGEK